MVLYLNLQHHSTFMHSTCDLHYIVLIKIGTVVANKKMHITYKLSQLILVHAYKLMSKLFEIIHGLNSYVVKWHLPTSS